VRWTEQRNFEAVLELMADKWLDVQPLISHRFPVEDAAKAYAVVTGDAPALGVLLEYAKDVSVEGSVQTRTVAVSDVKAPGTGGPVIGFVGAGNHASSVLAPAFAGTRSRLRAIASNNGLTGTHIGRRFGFELSTTDVAVVFGDPQIDTVVIATRHDSHAAYVVDGLRAGKHIFVENRSPFGWTRSLRSKRLSGPLAQAAGRRPSSWSGSTGGSRRMPSRPKRCSNLAVSRNFSR